MQEPQKQPSAGWREILFLVWVGGGLALLYPVVMHLDAGFPVFTVVWLAVPLLAVLRRRSAELVGFRTVPGRRLGVTTAINLGLLLLVIALFEPWSGAYEALVQKALRGDVTFAWLVRYDSLVGWLPMLLFSGLVTIFAEELFFRGWLLQLLLRRVNHWPAILLQAALFALLQALPALILSPLQAVVWVGAYAFLGVGLLNGWAAARTESIWPGLIAATLMNLIVTALVL